MPTDDPLLDPAAHESTLRRLKAAGVLAAYGRLPDGAQWVKWSDSYLALLAAGRDPLTEPGLQAAWASGDPLQVRRWIEEQAESLKSDGGAAAAEDARGSGEKPW